MALLFGIVALLAALGLWLWTPDLPRSQLEAHYAAPPSTFLDVQSTQG